MVDRPLDPKQARVLEKLPSVICFALASSEWKNNEWPPYIYGFVSNPEDPKEISCALDQARRFIELRHENQQLHYRLELERDKRQQLINSAAELAEERELKKLCGTVLTTMRKLVNSEAASLYLYDLKRDQLRFSQVQNEQIPIEFKEVWIPLDESSLVGACAIRKKIIHVPDVHKISKNETFEFNPRFDQSTGYQTRSVVSFPLVKKDGQLVGVIQLLNSKRSSCFTDEDIDLGKALSIHTAVALETALLSQNIEDLFEGFIKASITAIESRDPATSGHSERVADLTVSLAQRASESGQKPFGRIHFNDLQLKEIRYASLLHDFGKIGVPEQILTKEKKLYPHELKTIHQRFQVLKLSCPDRSKEFEELWNKILKANEPSILVEQLKQDLSRYVEESLYVNKEKIELLTGEEWHKLSVTKGSLSPEDRKQIESHVTHSFRFLKQIPWTRTLSRVPDIAGAHHERLDGSGYPYGLKKEEIPIESQVMAVADVFDALTAGDRPYKAGVPVPKALEILTSEAEEFKLEPDLVLLFKEQKIYKILKGL